MKQKLSAASLKLWLHLRVGYYPWCIWPLTQLGDLYSCLSLQWVQKALRFLPKVLRLAVCQGGGGYGCVGSQETIPHCLRRTFCGTEDPVVQETGAGFVTSCFQQTLGWSGQCLTFPDFPMYPFGLPLMKPLALQLWQGSLPGVCATVLLCNLCISLHLMVITYLKRNDN